ncbi:sensor histidine kinase [Roseivirga sp. E12]|uniref:sensor histidine kinase n=1 Tax=Roseivirga sp. E12 TaxID=2819237 RepID=UPI001ABC4A00|nr:histidine kinase [Roseivirga sp. E12]MBO3700860.1 histidine kinase [Roseivirga sp. E12]
MKLQFLSKGHVPIWVKFVLPLTLMFLLWLSANMASLYREPPGFSGYVFFWFLTVLSLLWSIVALISRQLDINVPWHENVRKRVITQVILVTIIGVVLFDLAFIVLNWMENQWFNKNNPLAYVHLVSSTLMGLILISLINSLQVAFELNHYRQSAQIQSERLQVENVQSQLENLKQQIDPHFLFNNFSTLYSLIHEDQAKAGQYLLRLSEVYRGVLSTTQKEMISLADELNLLDPYIDLLIMRYGASLKIEKKIEEVELNNFIPTMALQMLVENAIKHNVIDHNSPLELEVTVSQGVATVSNRIRRKNIRPDGENIGLSNLSRRSVLLTGKDINISQNHGTFSVSIPLKANNNN